MVLIKYKKSDEKIVKILLSIIFQEHEFKKLQSTLQKYEENSDWKLYLWKQDEDFVGLIGLKVNDQTFTVQHVAVTPFYRNRDIGRTMIETVQQLHEPLAMCAAPGTKDFLSKCWDLQHYKFVWKLERT